MYRLRTGYVRNKVKSGRYNNASEVVREALRRMEDQDARRAGGKAQRGGHPNGPDGGAARRHPAPRAGGDYLIYHRAARRGTDILDEGGPYSRGRTACRNVVGQRKYSLKRRSGHANPWAQSLRSGAGKTFRSE